MSDSDIWGELWAATVTRATALITTWHPLRFVFLRLQPRDLVING